MSKSTGKPLVAILMGSKNDWETMQAAGQIFDEFGIRSSFAGACGGVHESG
jgi:phosphoribosylcarboxyaminoimidazole (NCAIR) mutase